MSDDVLITPASRKIEFKDSGGNIDGTIQLDSSGNLVLTSSVGLLIGDLDADIHIGDGSNTVDMVFDFAGSIYSAANQDLTIGKKSLGGNNVKIDTPAMMRITSAYGYVDIGPNNASWSHFYTDRPKYYFNKGVIVDEGIIGSYNEDLKLVTDQDETRVTIKATDGQVLIGKTAGEASIDRLLEVDGTIAAFDSGQSAGVGFHMGNSEGEFLIYTDGGALIVKDYAGSDTYPFKIEGAAQNDTLVVNTGGDVTVKDQLYIGSEIIHSGDTNNKIAFGTDTQTFTTAGSARMTIEADGDIAMTEDLDVAKHFSFNTQHVGGSAGGSTDTENGANTWCKILTWDPGTTQYRDLSLTLGITCVDVGSQNQAIIGVYGRSNGTGSAHTMGIKVISMVSASQLRDDSFKMITEGWGQPIELWMKKYGSYTTWNWNEIAKKLGSSTTLTYSSNSAWQSTEPVKTGGTPASVRSFGTVIEGRQSVLNLYHNQNVSQLSAGDVLSTISFRKHTGHGGNESIRIYNVQGDSGSSGASDDYHTSDLRISTRKIGTNAYTDRFTILGQEGHVGIGTMSPTFVSGSGLHIYDSTQANLRLEDAAGEFFDVAMQNGDAYLINRVSDGFMSFRTNSTERIRITSGGDVGIGTASPDTSLHVKGSGLQYLKLESTDDNAGVQIMSDSLDSWLIYSPDGTPDLRFFTDTGYSVSGDAADLVEVMTLDGTNHRVGIGDTSPNGVLHVYRNDSTTTVPLLKLHEDSVYADNPTLEVITDRTDGAIPSISVTGGAVTAAGPNGWGTWEKETFFKHSYGTSTGQGSGLINRTHDGVGTINNFTLPYDAKLRAVVVSYSFSGTTSSTADQTWRLFHSGNPANVISDFTFDLNNDMTNMHGNFYVYVATGLDIQMDKNKSISVRRESGNLNIQNQVRFDVYFTRHTGNF